MDRRTLLEAGALSGMTFTIKPRAARPEVPPPVSRPGPVDDMDAYLARVDAGMERIGRWSVTAGYPHFTGDREATDALARSAVQSLYLTGMFGDLPPAQQAHPGMQERMWAALPLMDDALERMHGFLASRTDADLARVQAALRSDEHVADRIADAFDAEAAATGVSDWRRQQVRGMISLAAWRMTHQPPALIVDEYQGKIARVDASDIAAAARRRWMDSRLGAGLFWDRARHSSDGILTARDLAEGPRSLREQRIARGLKAMGIGLVIFGLGAGIASSQDDISGWVVVATVGAVWFIVGFFILLVGLGTSQHESPADSSAAPPKP